VVAIGAHDALSAVLVERAGFNAVYIGSFATEATFLGQPDLALMPKTERLMIARNIVKAVDVPVIADMEEGYGNAISMMDAVRDFEAIGLAGVHIDDQALPSKCPFLAGIPRSELISEEEIAHRLRDMGEEISRDYQGERLLVVGVLRGAFMVMADLARHISIPVEFDFMAVSSYGSSTKTSGVVRILKDLDEEIAGRHVLLVEDIVDSGLTLDYLLRTLRLRNPSSIELATLLLKEGTQQIPVEARYVGFRIGPEFVVGYGLDFDQLYRNLPYVGVLDEHSL